MRSLFVIPVGLFALVVTGTGRVLHAAQTPQSAPVPTFQVVHAASGPHGTESGGQFQLDEERTTFSRIADTQVVVSFQWEGAPGAHKMSGRWRSPNGGIAISDFDYAARARVFGGYWSLPLSASSPLGTWTFEASIDGLPSGTLTFDVTDSTALPETSRRRSLEPAELFDRIASVFVVIERTAIRDPKVERASGFVYAPGVVVTSFGAVDAADALRLVTANGVRDDVAALDAWNRAQDWALIPSAVARAAPLALAASLPKVGDRCYSMQATEGTRLLVDCEIIGQSGQNGGDRRLVARFSTGVGVAGAPVVNTFGEVLGIVSGGFQNATLTIDAAHAETGGVSIILASTVQAAGTPTRTSLQNLHQQNVLLPAVNGGRHLVGSGFAHQVDRNTLQPIDVRSVFTSGDGHFIAFLEWQARERLRGALVLRLFDESSRVLVQSKPSKVDIKPGINLRPTTWELPVPARPGTYRVEVTLDDVPMWRGFIRVR